MLAPVDCTCWTPSPMTAEAIIGFCYPGVRRLVEAAAPVNLLVALGQQVLWPESVALKVPLLLNCLSMDCSQGIAPAWLPVGTDGTARGPLGPGANIRLPDMLMATRTLCTKPPGFPAGAHGDCSWLQIFVEGGMPLCSHFWVALCEVFPPCTTQAQRDSLCMADGTRECMKRPETNRLGAGKASTSSTAHFKRN